MSQHIIIYDEGNEVFLGTSMIWVRSVRSVGWWNSENVYGDGGIVIVVFIFVFYKRFLYEFHTHTQSVSVMEMWVMLMWCGPISISHGLDHSFILFSGSAFMRTHNEVKWQWHNSRCFSFIHITDLYRHMDYHI